MQIDYSYQTGQQAEWSKTQDDSTLSKAAIIKQPDGCKEVWQQHSSAFPPLAFILLVNDFVGIFGCVFWIMKIKSHNR